MHDCRKQGGHFFVYKPQGYAFQCCRCNEPFASSYTNDKLRHPWKCLLERCGYVACDPCSDILAEELAVPHRASPSKAETLQSLSMKGVKVLPEDEKPVELSQKRIGGLRRGALESGMVSGFRDLIVRDIPKRLGPRGYGVSGEKFRDPPGLANIEVDDDYNEPYAMPVFTRTARQVAAEAVMKRAQNKLKPVTRRGGERSDI